MQRLDVSRAVRPIYESLGVKRLMIQECSVYSLVTIPTKPLQLAFWTQSNYVFYIISIFLWHHNFRFIVYSARG